MLLFIQIFFYCYGSNYDFVISIVIFNMSVKIFFVI